jgi:hypothetical protein
MRAAASIPANRAPVLCAKRFSLRCAPDLSHQRRWRPAYQPCGAVLPALRCQWMSCARLPGGGRIMCVAGGGETQGWILKCGEEQVRCSTLALSSRSISRGGSGSGRQQMRLLLPAQAPDNLHAPKWRLGSPPLRACTTPVTSPATSTRRFAGPRSEILFGHTHERAQPHTNTQLLKHRTAAAPRSRARTS